MRITDGVYAFPQTLDRGDHEATFHPAGIETANGLLLLDVGFPDEVDQLRDRVDAAGYGWDDVWAVLLTHQDGDHAGATSAIRQRTGAATFAHEQCAPVVRGDEEPIKGGGTRYPPTEVDVELVDGVTFGTVAGPMRVVHAPGHTPGHVSLYLPDERLLIAADALTAPEGELSGPKPEFTSDMGRAAESVGRLAELDVEQVLCYHGGLVDAGTDRIAEVHASLTG